MGISEHVEKNLICTASPFLATVFGADLVPSPHPQLFTRVYQVPIACTLSTPPIDLTHCSCSPPTILLGRL